MIRPGCNAFSLLEILVLIALLAVLAVFLSQVVQKGLAKAKETACISRMRQLGSAVYGFAMEHNGLLPIQKENQMGFYSEESWTGQLLAYTGDYRIMSCTQTRPGSAASPPNSFLYNGYVSLWRNPRGLEGVRLTQSQQPSRDFLVIDFYSKGRGQASVNDLAQWPTLPAPVGWYPHPLEDDRTRRLDSSQTILFVDAHVETRKMRGEEIALKNYRWPYQ